MRDRAVLATVRPADSAAALQGRSCAGAPLLPGGWRQDRARGRGPGAALHLPIVGESTANKGSAWSSSATGLRSGLARAIARVEGRSVAFQNRGEAAPRSRAPAPRRYVRRSTWWSSCSASTMSSSSRAAPAGRPRSTLVHDLTPRARLEIVFTRVPPLGSIRSLPEPMRSDLGARGLSGRAPAPRVPRTGAHHGDVTFLLVRSSSLVTGFIPPRRGTHLAEALVASRAGWPHHPWRARGLAVVSSDHAPGSWLNRTYMALRAARSPHSPDGSPSPSPSWPVEVRPNRRPRLRPPRRGPPRLAPRLSARPPRRQEHQEARDERRHDLLPGRRGGVRRIKLAALSYGFRDDRLATVRFELAEASWREDARRPKPSASATLPGAQPNAGRGTSYTWSRRAGR